MTDRAGIDGDIVRKVLLNSGTDADAKGASHRADFSPQPEGLETDAAGAEDDLVRLVLAVIETVRQLVERQAIRRVESGTLSDDDVERLGLALMRLEERMSELKAHFGVEDGDLALHLGTARDLMATLTDDGLGTSPSPARSHAPCSSGEVPC